MGLWLWLRENEQVWGFQDALEHILMVSRALGRLSAATCGCVGLAACHNAVCPLRVVWDLDETLVSSRRVPADPRAPPPPPNQRLRVAADGACIEHVDDDALRFVTHARPHARGVLRALRLAPGVEQYVSTAASPGYMANVLSLLDPAGELFAAARASEPSRGKDVARVVRPPGADAGLRRTVLVDNRPSCHSPQPANGILVADFVHPAPDDRELVRVAGLLLLCWLLPDVRWALTPVPVPPPTRKK